MDLIVKLVEDKTDSFNKALGLTDERIKELEKAYAHIAIDNDQFSNIAAEMSKLCRHPNELLFIGVQIGKEIVQAHLSHTGEDIAEMIRRSLKEKGIDGSVDFMGPTNPEEDD